MLPPDLLDVIKAGGAAIAPFLGFLWWLERQERIREREEHKTVSKDMVTAMVKTESALTTLGDIFKGARGGAAPP